MVLITGSEHTRPSHCIYTTVYTILITKHTHTHTHSITHICGLSAAGFPPLAYFKNMTDECVAMAVMLTIVDISHTLFCLINDVGRWTKCQSNGDICTPTDTQTHTHCSSLIMCLTHTHTHTQRERKRLTGRPVAPQCKCLLRSLLVAADSHTLKHTHTHSNCNYGPGRRELKAQGVVHCLRLNGWQHGDYTRGEV